MKHSPYIAWAKENHDVKFNLAGSNISIFQLKDVVSSSAAFLESGSHGEGWDPLIQCIAERYEVGANQITLAHGASMANHLVYALLLNPGDHVLIEHPCYEPLKTLARYFRSEVSFFSRKAQNNYQPDIAEIKEKIRDNTKLIVLTDLHNPTGYLVERKIIGEIAGLAEKHSCYVLVDEVYLEFLYQQGVRTSFKPNSKIITTRSITKAFGMDDLRLGWITAPVEVTKRLRRLKDLFSIIAAFPSERLAHAVLLHADSLLDKGLTLLKSNQAKVNRFISTQPSLEWCPPDHGSIGFVRLKRGSVDDFVPGLKSQYNTLVAPGRFFGVPDHFRIGWGMEEEKFTKGLNNIEQYFKQRAT